MESALGCKPKRTASEEKKTFDDILKNALTDSEYDSDEVIINVHQALNYIAEENCMSNTPSTLDNHAMENLKTSIPEDIAIKIEAACIEEFGDESPVLENIVDTKAIENHCKKQREQRLQKEVEELKEQIKEISTENRSLPWAENNSGINTECKRKKSRRNRSKNH